MTPMMEQYHRIKNDHKECLLFFRMGEFYELFFDDAIKAADILDITLTRRGQHKGEDIPMCGVPVHSHESYVAKLIKAGHKVALCEQMEDPIEAKKRGHKAVVERAVIRVVTQGTLTEEGLLDSRRHNFLMVLNPMKEHIHYAFFDISTGDLCVGEVHEKQLESLLQRINPAEIIMPESYGTSPYLYLLFESWKRAITPLSPSRFDKVNAFKRCQDIFGVRELSGLGHFKEEAWQTMGVLLDYVTLTQKTDTLKILKPVLWSDHDFVDMDASTQQNLELIQTLSGDAKGSLLESIDYTLTAPGARLMAMRLVSPLKKVSLLLKRQEAITWAYDHSDARQEIRSLLKHVPDLIRPLTRLQLKRGGPQDLAKINQGLFYALKIHDILKVQKAPSAFIMEHLDVLNDIHDTLNRALASDMPLLMKDGGFIREGFHAELDDIRSWQEDGQHRMLALQTKYQSELGIMSLKIKHNNIIGYHVEVTALQASKMDDRFLHRQTMANAMRFTTAELSDIEEKVVTASNKITALELALFDDLAQTICNATTALTGLALCLAEIDFSCALALLAHDRQYVCPVLDDSSALTIENGRHPVVEVFLKKKNMTFTANTCQLNPEKQIWLLTGPNMAGKSTFLRQTALIVLLAQMGSYVPASYAHIGLVDKIYSRVGASDNLARGQSTFMIEMVETAAILNQATSKSLVILDEVGRGTATYDGLSLAWAVLEHLHDTNQCRGLFATHYHELTTLESRLRHLKCHTVKVKEWNNDIHFLHEVIEGKADRSYGIHVATLAGMPKGVIKRAERLLKNLEDKRRDVIHETKTLPLFQNSDKTLSVFHQLKTLDLDTLTLDKALDIIKELKTDLS